MPKNLGTTVILRPDFERAILRSTDVEGFLQELADEAAEYAKDSAAYRSGHLEGGIEAQVVLSDDSGGLVGRVVSKDFKSLWLELGTRRTRAQPYLLPALEAVVPGVNISRR